MKLSDATKSSYWQIGFLVGAILFLLLTAFFGYKLWSNSKSDIEKIQQVREFQLTSANALFFSKKAVSGDASAIDPLVKTFESLDVNIENLQTISSTSNVDAFDKVFSLWQEAKDNERVLVDIEYAINLINGVEERLSAAALVAEKVAISNVEQMVTNRASVREVTGLTRQATLLGQMASNIREFINSDKAGKESFDKFRTNFTAFEQNHIDLINGNSGRDIRPVSNAQVIQGLNQFRGLLNGVRTADTYIFQAVDAVLKARTSQSSIANNLESLQFSLADASTELTAISKNRFPGLTSVIITGLLAVLCLIGFIYMQRSTSRSQITRQREEGQRTQGAILRLLDELVDLADGDLTISATVSEDFTGAIADSINFTIDQLRQLVSRINSTAVQVSQAAQGTQQTALHLAEASDHQAQEIAGASAAINEMAVTIDQVSANASESALVAGKSVSIANNGAKLVQNTIHGMDTIREQIQDTSKRIKRLGESSQEIGDIVSLINDIADQTNILALNAAIQASMAGDAGRGFAVVADEVQRLAERSAAATKQIETLVKTIQTDTNEAVISMEQTTSEVVRGARLAQDAGVALEEIEGVSANLAELIQNISNAARQQASSAGHISNTMNVIQEITSQTSAGTSETAQSIGDLARMAFDLRESVAGFTLPGETDQVDEVEDFLSDVDTSAVADIEPPVLEQTVDLDSSYDESQIDNLLEDMDIDEGAVEDDEDFFDMLAEDDDDLLSEFEIDITDDTYPDSEGEATRKG